MKKTIIAFMFLAANISFAAAPERNEVRSEFNVTESDTWTSTVTVYGSKGHLKVQGDGVLLTANGTSNGSGLATQSGLGIIELSDKASIKTDGIFIRANGKLDISSDAGTLYTNQIWNRGTVVVSKDNAIVNKNGNGIATLQCDTAASGEKNCVVLNANQAFNLKFYNANPATTFEFGKNKNATLTLASISYANTGNITSIPITLKDFVGNGSIVFKTDVLKAPVEGLIAGNIITLSDDKQLNFTLVDDLGEIDASSYNLRLDAVADGFVLTALSAVPEPAEWAAIFGAIALSFAIYRRKRA